MLPVVILAKEYAVEICVETQMVAILDAETQDTQKDDKSIAMTLDTFSRRQLKYSRVVKELVSNLWAHDSRR